MAASLVCIFFLLAGAATMKYTALMVRPRVTRNIIAVRAYNAITFLGS
jgi:hypothetical protein